MDATKIKRSELPVIRKKLIVKQFGVCPICKKSLIGVSPSNIVVDHDHDTGVIRAALHRGCNGLDGKIIRLVRTWGKASSMRDVIRVLENLISFWKKHQTPQTEWIYPTHKTPAEKRAALNKKRRKTYARKKREEC